MSEITLFQRETDAARVESRAIVDAYRFLEDVSRQVEALRKTLREQLKDPTGDLAHGGFEARNFATDHEDSEPDGWLCRSCIDTFDIVLAKGKRHVFFAGLQISLAPPMERADPLFFPHVAVLLGGKSSWRTWECEEFALDDESLCDHDDPWHSAGELRWVAKSGDQFVAFVVPLTSLHDVRDVRSLILEPMVREARSMISHVVGVM